MIIKRSKQLGLVAAFIAVSLLAHPNMAYSADTQPIDSPWVDGSVVSVSGVEASSGWGTNNTHPTNTTHPILASCKDGLSEETLTQARCNQQGGSCGKRILCQDQTLTEITNYFDSHTINNPTFLTTPNPNTTKILANPGINVTSTTTTQSFTLQIGPTHIAITAKPVLHTWNFGDNTPPRSTTHPGKQITKNTTIDQITNNPNYITHRYPYAGPTKGITLTTSWLITWTDPTTNTNRALPNLIQTTTKTKPFHTHKWIQTLTKNTNPNNH